MREPARGQERELFKSEPGFLLLGLMFLWENQAKECNSKVVGLKRQRERSMNRFIALGEVHVGIAILNSMFTETTWEELTEMGQSVTTLQLPHGDTPP